MKRIAPALRGRFFDLMAVGGTPGQPERLPGQPDSLAQQPNVRPEHPNALAWIERARTHRYLWLTAVSRQPRRAVGRAAVPGE